MAPSTMRKAIGVVKDQTSIGLAKVSSNMAPELDVLVVKATSHDDGPAEERHLREILHLTSCSRAYVSYCVSAVSRRLSKTRDWIVALKSLVLVHRLLADGDPSFHQEVLYATRRGTRLLNLSDFRDEAHSRSWDHSAFVRTYALYLDQRLEFFLHERKNSSLPVLDRNQDRFRSPDPYQDRPRHSDPYQDRPRHSDPYQDRYRSPDPYNYGDGSHGNGRYDNGSYGRSPSAGRSPPYGRSPPPYTSPREEENKKAPTPVRDMKPEQVLVRMHHLQQLLDRFLACRPTGIAKHDRMILVALYPIIRESFQLYADVCEMLAVLLDRFFDMEYNECVKAFEAYASAAKQIDELCAFYGWCKETGVARSSEYPEVQKITDKLLETLEEFMRDRAKRPKSPEPAPEPEPVKEEEPPVEDMNSIKALPPPEDWKEEEPAEPVKEEVQEPPPPPKPEQPLVDLREDTVSADEQGNRLALALFSGPPTNGSNGSWNAFGSSDDSQVTSAWQNPAAEPGKADWELALVETASNLSKQKADLPGGFDPLLLNGMYDQGAVKQHVNANMTTGSASSVALPLPGKAATQVLALPAPDGSVQTIGGDPFAASLTIPPPSYVQISDMEKKQQLLVQEQQVWNQYQKDGMQGQASLNKIDHGYNNGFGTAGFMPNPAMPYGMPMAYAGNPGYYYPTY
ncbi:ENTH/ANTH/VHS superfamily protein [Rhynchospora pubera]|uniref:ENTH/ANTH/VHS superfamily protein n=1 Tax=Rhynchospora pubera TaxID=906938 RepID=A0AAV8FQ72_9POAL|nr:ENTH/ANTH/VHS superfamily protein [Rhynchospora pubera]